MKIKNRKWFDSWPEDVPKSIEYPLVPLNEILEKTAKKHPEKTAIEYSEGSITYKKFDSFSNHFARALASLDIKKGDRVAICLPNIPQFLIAYFGILKAGAVPTAISPLHKEREIVYQLSDSEAETIIFLNTHSKMIKQLWQKTKLRSAIVTTLEDYASKNTISTNLIESKQKVYSFKELVKEYSNSPSLKVDVNPKEDLAALQYTGGTTGTAKGAMLTHSNLVANAIMFAAWIKGSEAKETFLTVLPLFHIYGMTTSMNVPIYLAAKMVLLPRFDPTKVLEVIQRHKVTVFCGVPTMYSLLLANPELHKFDLTSIRICVSGASPLPPQVQKQFISIINGIIVEGYGLTEASPVTHCNPVDKKTPKVRLGSIGLPLPNTDSKIFDLETGELPLDSEETGELAVKGPQIMRGYWKRSDETRFVLREGWLFTGDIGKMDKDGYFYITDRKKDLIKYKDYSVYPRELEDVIYEHPDVKLCAVVGKQFPIVGEIPKAFIVLKDGARTTGAEIVEFVREKVAAYKVVREVEFRKKLPTSAAGKVLRRVLKEEEKGKALNPSRNL